MLLTKPQQTAFWRMWAGACDVQGWMGNEREARRKEVLLECGFSSLTQVDRTAGFDRVKGALQRLQYRLEGGRESAFPDVGEMRRHVHLIRTHLVPGIASHVEDPEAYVAAIVRDKFGTGSHWSSLAANPQSGPVQIRQLLYTLTRALHHLQAEARASRKTGPVLDKPLNNPPVLPSVGQIDPLPVLALGSPT